MTDDERQKRIDAIKPPRGDIGPQHSYQSDRARLAQQQVERASNWMAAQEPRPLRFDARDLADSLPDAFRMRAGMRVKTPHPMADWASELSFQRLAEQLQCRSLNASDFGSALSTGFRQLVTSAYSAVDDCGPCFLDAQVPDFKAVAFPVVDEIDLAALPLSNGQMASHIPLQLLSADSGEPQGRVQSYRARVLISRQLLLSDDFQLISNLLRHLAGHAARLPAIRLADVLNSNSNLADGDPLRTATNQTSTTGYSVTALAGAAAVLRTALSPTGNTLNLAPAVWLTPPAGEFLARQTLKLVDSSIKIVVNPWLSGDYSFLLCDPTVSPIFVRLMLSQPLVPNVSSVPTPPHFDGQILDVELVFGISVVDRRGLVAIPVS